jgi:hypothetical protein
MSDVNKAFDFSQFVPGFEFLKNLSTASAATGTAAGVPSLASWIAPTLSVEDVDKRIQELKTVLFWLEQNGHALKATIQALEVQKMTLSALRGMNVRLEDLASAFKPQASAVPAFQASAPAPSPAPAPKPQSHSHSSEAAASAAAQPSTPGHAHADKAAAAPGEVTGEAAGAVDPLQWWGALTQQFQQIAGAALQEAAQMKMPEVGAAKPSAAVRTAAKTAVKTTAKKAASAAGGKPAAKGRSAAASSSR